MHEGVLFCLNIDQDRKTVYEIIERHSEENCNSDAKFNGSISKEKIHDFIFPEDRHLDLSSKLLHLAILSIDEIEYAVRNQPDDLYGLLFNGRDDFNIPGEIFDDEFSLFASKDNEENFDFTMTCWYSVEDSYWDYGDIRDKWFYYNDDGILTKIYENGVLLHKDLKSILKAFSYIVLSTEEIYGNSYIKHLMNSNKEDEKELYERILKEISSAHRFLVADVHV